MMNQPEWQWNEIQQVGTDYTDLAEVEAYDKRMASFRDVDTENQSILDMLKLPKGAQVLEIGCGTGRFARAASAAGLNVSAADVSPIMLEYVRAKTEEEGLTPITLQHAGFLTMDFPGESFDAVVSCAALHHIPDAWKQVALNNVFRVLKAGGKFILGDVVFAVAEDENPQQCFEKFVNSFNEKIRPGAMGHVKKEYSTYDWIMDGLITRAGFAIESKEVFVDNFMVYLCGK